MKKIIAMLIVSMIVTGCSRVEQTVTKETENEIISNDSLDDSFYPILKLKPNTGRNEYYNTHNLTKDFQTIGRELEVLSTKHFSTNEYFMSDGQFLKYENIEDDLLLWAKDDNPYTLQPKKTTKIEGYTNVIMTSSVYELDFYKKTAGEYKLAGVSFAIILDPLTKPEGQKESRIPGGLSEQFMSDYSATVMETLYKYIQENDEYSDIQSTPLLISTYEASDPQISGYNGGFTYQSFCDGSFKQPQAIEFEKVIFSSEISETIDPTTNNEFLQFKNLIKDNSLEAVGVVGYGTYRDNRLSEFTINITANIKTYIELEYLVSLVAGEINTRFSTPVGITVTIHSQDELEAVIIKEHNKEAVSSMIY